VRGSTPNGIGGRAGARGTTIGRGTTGAWGWRWIACCAFLVLADFVAGCGSKESAIKVGEYGSLTGDKATFGKSTHMGIEMAVEEANAAGGAGGLPLQIITEDDQGKPEEAATAVNKLIVQDQVVTVLGEVASSNSLAGAPICQENKVPMITPASTNPAVTQVGPYIFRVCFIDPFQGTVMARFAYQSLGLRKVAVLRDAKSDYSVGLSRFFQEEFTSLGGEIAGDESYQQGDVDFKAPLTALINRSPDGFFVPGYYTEVGLVARQARELGYKGPLFGGDGWDSPKLVEIGGAAIEGGYFSNHYSTEDPNPVVQNFVQRFRQKHNEDPDAMAALGYDAARLLLHCLQALKEQDAALFKALESSTRMDASGKAARANALAKLRELLAATSEFPGVTGVISLDADRNARKPAVVLQVRDGKYRFVERIAGQP
jgi:branched-chain amino acid transport system substrate-binding protein